MKIGKKDLAWQFFSLIVTFGVNFLTLPFLLKFLSSAEIAIWYILLSIASFVSLLDFGLNPSISRNVTYAYSGVSELKKHGVSSYNLNKPNIELLNEVVNSTKKIYSYLGIISFILLIVFGSYYMLSIIGKTDVHYLELSWLIFVGSMVFNIYFSYISVILRGIGKIRELNKSMVIARFIQLGITILLLFFGFNLLGASLGWFAYGFFFRIIGISKINESNLFTKSHNKYSSNPLTLIKLIWPNSWREALISFTKYVTTQVTTLILPFFIDLDRIATYSITLQLLIACASISTSIYVALQPRLQYTNAKNDIVTSKEIVSISITSYYALYFTGSFILFFIGIPLLSYIKHDMIIDIKMFISIFIYIGVLYGQNAFASIISTKNVLPYVKGFVITSFVSLVVNFLYLSISRNPRIDFLVYFLLSTQLLYNSWKWPLYVFKDYNLSIVEVLKLSLYYSLRLIREK